jgi:hypothetical protein
MNDPGIIFQQDNAKIHRSYRAQEWFERHGIEVLDWPAHSPDLSPIEPQYRDVQTTLAPYMNDGFWRYLAER